MRSTHVLCKCFRQPMTVQDTSIRRNINSVAVISARRVGTSATTAPVSAGPAACWKVQLSKYGGASGSAIVDPRHRLTFCRATGASQRLVRPARQTLQFAGRCQVSLAV
jgi:hypothetical protein